MSGVWLRGLGLEHGKRGSASLYRRSKAQRLRGPGSRGRAPWSEIQERSPPEAERLLRDRTSKKDAKGQNRVFPVLSSLLRDKILLKLFY